MWSLFFSLYNNLSPRLFFLNSRDESYASMCSDSTGNIKIVSLYIHNFFFIIIIYQTINFEIKKFSDIFSNILQFYKWLQKILTLIIASNNFSLLTRICLLSGVTLISTRSSFNFILRITKGNWLLLYWWYTSFTIFAI